MSPCLWARLDPEQDLHKDGVHAVTLDRSTLPRFIEENNVAFVAFIAPWCVACARIEAHVLPNEAQVVHVSKSAFSMTRVPWGSLDSLAVSELTFVLFANALGGNYLELQ